MLIAERGRCGEHRVLREGPLRSSGSADFRFVGRTLQRAAYAARGSCQAAATAGRCRRPGGRNQSPAARAVVFTGPLKAEVERYLPQARSWRVAATVSHGRDLVDDGRRGNTRRGADDGSSRPGRPRRRASTSTTHRTARARGAQRSARPGRWRRACASQLATDRSPVDTPSRLACRRTSSRTRHRCARTYGRCETAPTAAGACSARKLSTSSAGI